MISLRLLFLSIYLLSVSLLFGIPTSNAGGVEISAFPTDRQIYQREKNLTVALVAVAGEVSDYTDFATIKLVVSLDSFGGQDVLLADLNYEDGKASFIFDYELQADFFNHQFLLYGIKEGVDELVYEAENVLAGDVFIISGQSNALAKVTPDVSDQIEFTRGFKNGKWNYLKTLNPGIWGARLAHILADSLGYPIGILNFAKGAKKIDYFQKDLADSTNGNYGKMVADMTEASVLAPMAFIWFQGSADSYISTTEAYYEALQNLHGTWKADFEIDYLFIFQHRFGNCNTPKASVLEAQRLYARDKEDAFLMSTTNTNSDGCLWYEDGFLILGDRMAPLVLNRIYNRPFLPSDYAPNIERIVRKDSMTLTLHFLPKGAPLQIIGNPIDDFIINENTEIESLEVQGQVLVVHLKEPVEAGETLSYLGHQGAAPDWIASNKNVGLITFEKIPITPGFVNPSFTGGMGITDFPVDHQIVERTDNSLTGLVKIAGSVADYTDYNQVKLVVTIDDLGNQDEMIVDLVYLEGKASFEIYYNLAADFFNHQFSLYGIHNDTEQIEWQTKKVLCGDIFIITGQSNAVAKVTPDTSDMVEFTRSFKAGEWNYLKNLNPGIWGGRLVHRLSDSLGYPVGILNFAHGGKQIAYFQKDGTDTTNGNYGEMLHDLSLANIKNPKALLWFQGTADSYQSTIDDYYNALSALHQDWIADLGIAHLFMFQHRYQNCGTPLPDVFEAQRLYAKNMTEVSMMSSTNAESDSCHFTEPGFLVLGDRMAPLVLDALYGLEQSPDEIAVDVLEIVRTDSVTLTISFFPDNVPLKIIGNPINDFRIEEGGEIESVEVVGEQVILKLQAPLPLGQHLSYLGHPGSSPDWVCGESGVGVLTFYNHPILANISATLPIHTDFRIYPNPVADICSIENNLLGATEVILFNVLGQVSLRKKMNGKQTISFDMKHLPKGIYQCVVHAQNGVFSKLLLID